MVQETILRWTVAGGGSGLSVLYWNDAATSVEINGRVQAALTELASGLATTTTAALDPVLSQRSTVSGELIGEGSIASPANINGSGGTSAVPNVAQGLVRLSTASIISGRKLKGRIFIPGMAQIAAGADGNVSSSGLADLQAFGTALAANGHLVVWHRPVAGAGGSAGTVTSTSAWSEFATQRRRRS